MSRDSAQRTVPSWTLLTSHGLVLLYISAHGDATIREIADELSMTERRVIDVIRDLADEYLVRVRREGRNNRYKLNPDARFRHPLMNDLPFEMLVSLWQRFRGPDAGGHSFSI